MAGSKSDRVRLDDSEIDAIVDDWIVDNSELFVNIDNPKAKMYAIFHKFVDVYAELGLPGAAGSMDCTHLNWNRCPKSEVGF